MNHILYFTILYHTLFSQSLLQNPPHHGQLPAILTLLSDKLTTNRMQDRTHTILDKLLLPSLLRHTVAEVVLLPRHTPQPPATVQSPKLPLNLLQGHHTCQAHQLDGD